MCIYIYDVYLYSFDDTCNCVCNVGICWYHLHHPPGKSLVMGGIPTIEHGWFMTYNQNIHL